MTNAAVTRALEAGARAGFEAREAGFQWDALDAESRQYEVELCAATCAAFLTSLSDQHEGGHMRFSTWSGPHDIEDTLKLLALAAAVEAAAGEQGDG